MIKQLFFLVLFLSTLQSFSQKLVYKSNGNILNSENQIITPIQIRELLANNEKLLSQYNAGRAKKTAGNVLLASGISFIIIDLISGVTSDGATTIVGNGYSIQSERNYPTVLTYIGAAAIVIAIPIKIGFSKKIKNVVTEYNNLTATGFNHFNKQELNFITNSNGIGIRLTLN